MKRGQLRRRCTELIRSLDLPTPFDIDVLCDRVSASRGRPIRLAPLAFPAGGPGGLLVSTVVADYIFYEANTTIPHQTHVIVHELGHLLWQHAPAVPPYTELDGLLPEELDPAAVRHMFGRSQYAEPDEWAAEYFATQVLRKVSAWTVEPPSVPEEIADVVRRLERSLRHGHEHRG